MQPHQSDILIMGGGLAGTSAALAAARNGATVTLLEKRTSLGGLAVGGLVTPFMGVYFGDKRPVVAGNFDRLLDALNTHFPPSIDGLTFQAEAMKHTLEILLEEMGVDIRYDTAVTDIKRSGRTVTQVEARTKSGPARFTAKVYIDATGDGDAIALAGLPFGLGREEDGRTQACSLRFLVANVEVEAARAFLKGHEHDAGFHKIIEDFGKQRQLPIWDTYFQNFIIPGQPGTLAFNVPRLLGVNPTDADSLTAAYKLGRKLIRAYVELMRAHVPGCENAVIAQSAELLGVREGRRMQGAYTLTAEDVAQGTLFDDGVAGNAWFIDIHNPAGKGILGGRIHPGNGRNGVPYRSLYAREADNLLAAGRCVSATHEALAAIRIMPTCVATGEAAGVAAAMAAKAGCAVQAVDVRILRETLAAQGALVPGINLL